MSEARLKDVILMLFAIQITLIGSEGESGIVFIIGVLITLWVIIKEADRRLGDQTND